MWLGDPQIPFFYRDFTHRNLRPGTYTYRPFARLPLIIIVASSLAKSRSRSTCLNCRYRNYTITTSVETTKLLIFLDTEFTGLDQAYPDLISIGLVDECGREFYAELPESNWTVQCNEWVHFNVLPHLWGGKYVQSAKAIQERLSDWIESTPEDSMIVTDWPNGDFFTQLKRLLPQWPDNLNNWPMQFGSWSMGDEQEPVLRKMMDDYHTPQRPRHHALYDAHSLRLALMYAFEHGWQPCFGGEPVKTATERAAQSINESLKNGCGPSRGSQN